MQEIERLAAIEEIRQLAARRLRFMDQKLWDDYGAIHTEDAWTEAFTTMTSDGPASAPGKSGRVNGRQAIVDSVRDTVMRNIPMTTVHHIYQGEVTVADAGTAEATWPMEHLSLWVDGAREERMFGRGYYYEGYRKVDGRWLIAWRRMAYLHVEKTPGFFDRLAD